MCKCTLECNESPESSKPSWIQDTADFMTVLQCFIMTRQAQWMDLDLRKVHGGGRNLLSTAGPLCSKTEKNQDSKESRVFISHRIHRII